MVEIGDLVSYGEDFFRRKRVGIVISKHGVLCKLFCNKIIFNVPIATISVLNKHYVMV